MKTCLCGFCENKLLCLRCWNMSKNKTFIDMAENSDEPEIVRTAAGKAPMHMSQFIDDEAQDCEGFGCAFCGLLNCRCAYDIDALEDIEEDQLPEEEEEILDASPVRPSKRNSRFEYDEGMVQPDLAAYFEQFELTEQQQIAMCRTYANYLSQKVRSKFGAGGTKTYKGRSKNSGGNPKWKRIKVRPLDLEGDQE